MGFKPRAREGAPRWQSKVDVCGCHGCDFDMGSSSLAGLFLQDKTSRVVGSWGGPSNDQVRVHRGRMSSASSHPESRSVKILAHRSRVLSRPSGDSVSVAVVPSSSALGDSGTADALATM
ncbi:hypothetical protein GW17_00048789 [Ensete ventricosum]|nr:hypothetical protein GW17_00048789 [Ensete ventricosum]